MRQDEIAAIQLSQPIIDAIDAAVKTNMDGTIPPTVMFTTYCTEAKGAIANGMSEADIVSRFKQMAIQN